ncbi:hypothetical protein WT08_16380 [Burkholderia sp. MSMB1552]|nr:hypothetical protein WT08_16380 [Burkholderia sp. MSMB1552]KWZ54771.1 hypothetical protein WS92_01820 [Burkholderia sp. MSMB1588]
MPANACASVRIACPTRAARLQHSADAARFGALISTLFDTPDAKTVAPADAGRAGGERRAADRMPDRMSRRLTAADDFA